MSVSKVIKQLLAESNETQTKLAAALGITRQNLANKMSRDNFSTKDLCSICKYLGASLNVKDSSGKDHQIYYDSIDE